MYLGKRSTDSIFVLLLAVSFVLISCDSEDSGSEENKTDTQKSGQDEVGEDSSQQDTASEDDDASGDCWEYPGYSVEPSEATSMNVSATVDGSDFQISCSGTEVEFNVRNWHDVDAYSMKCNKDGWDFSLIFPRQQGIWTYQSQSDNPDGWVPLKFTLVGNGNAFDSENTGSDGGQVEITQYDSCSGESQGTFEAHFEAWEIANQGAPEATVSGSLHLVP